MASPVFCASMIVSVNMAVTAPHAAATVVVTAQRAAVAAESELSMTKAEPLLNERIIRYFVVRKQYEGGQNKRNTDLILDLRIEPIPSEPEDEGSKNLEGN